MSYHFHFKCSSIPLVFNELLWDKDGYGMFEHFLLQEGDLLIDYCSDRGVREQYQYGRENLFNSKKRHKIFEDIKIYDRQLTEFKPPAVKGLSLEAERAVWANIWPELKKLILDFKVYQIMEPMPMASLAEFVMDICKRDGLEQDRVLDDLSIAKNFSEEEKILTEALHTLGEMKLSVHNHVEPVIRMVHEMIDFIASQVNISIKEALVMTCNEIEEFLEQRTEPSANLKIRSKGLIIFTGGDEKTFRMADGEEYKKWKDILEPPFESDKIMGTIASRGKVIGPVVLHTSWINITQIPKGSILVTGMTNPQMVPYIKNAAAIVTDEGGLTCHAAIISREMKKPCVVGTKVATRVFKDGDIVQVDADNGIVEIIKRHL